MTSRFEREWEEVSVPATVERLVELQALAIEERGDVSNRLQCQLALVAEDPNAAIEALERARTTHFGMKPPDRSDDELFE